MASAATASPSCQPSRLSTFAGDPRPLSSLPRIRTEAEGTARRTSTMPDNVSVAEKVGNAGARQEATLGLRS